MFLFVHAKEIWYLVLSLCAVSFTAFVCWFLYYLVQAARDIKEAADEVKHEVEAIGEIIDNFKKKVSFFSSYALLAGQISKKLVEWLKKENWGEAVKNRKKKAKNTEKTVNPDEKSVPHDPEVNVFMQDEL